MDKITLLKHLTRLAQISEEVEEFDPRASENIDSQISDIADGAPDVEKPDTDLFPPIATPTMNRDVNKIEGDEMQEGQDMNSLAEKITRQILESPNFQSSDFVGEGGRQRLKQFVDQRINEVLGEGGDYQNNYPEDNALEDEDGSMPDLYNKGESNYDDDPYASSGAPRVVPDEER